MRLPIAYAVLTTFIATASASVDHSRPLGQANASATARDGAILADNEPAKADKKTPNRIVDKNRELARECERLESNGVRLPEKCRHR